MLGKTVFDTKNSTIGKICITRPFGTTLEKGTWLIRQKITAMIDILTTICNKIWKTGEWPTTWTHSLVITLPKKGNLQLCQNYRTISLISHPSMVILKIILNRLKPQAEEITAEEQAGFRAGRSTTEQIFNLRILGEKYLQHQQNLYHVFIDLKKAIDRVWHEDLWVTMRKYNINASTIRAIENLYDKAQSAVPFKGSTGEWFRTTIGVRQGCLLSPTLFDIFLERIMCEALDQDQDSLLVKRRNAYMWTSPDGHEGDLVFISGRLKSASGRLFDGIFNMLFLTFQWS